MPVLKNTRQERFAQAVAQGMTAEAAYAAAGYKPSRANASRLLTTNENIRERIKEIQKPALKKAEAKIAADAEKTLREAARIGFSDIRMLFDENGNLKAIHQLGDDTARAVKKVKIYTKPGKKGEDPIDVTEIEFWPKMDALGKLGQHFKLFGQDDDDDNDPIQRSAELMLAAAARPLPLAEPMTPALMAQNASPRRQRAPVTIEDAIEEEVEP